MRASVKFDSPPVVEVACGVLFASPGPIETVHIGAFWDRVKTQFPSVSDAPPLAPLVEQDGNAVAEYEWMDLPPLRRTWMVSENGCNLIQVQQDRFLFNWKRTLDQDVYPSYENVIRDFEKYFEAFMKFLDDVKVSRPVCKQFDLTYVNFIAASNGLDRVDVSNMFVDHIRSDSPERFLPELERFSWSTSYPLPEGTGRLHVVAQSAVNSATSEKIVRLDMIARGIPTTQSDGSMRAWFDTAHEWITHGFADATSPILQKEIWKRTS